MEKNSEKHFNQIKNESQKNIENSKIEINVKIKEGIESHKNLILNNKINSTNILNSNSEEYLKKLKDIEKNCEKEIQKKYEILLQSKISEIEKIIIEQVQTENQKILNEYIKQFMDLESNRKNEYNQFSSILYSKIDENNIIHEGIQCSQCSMNPIKGYRYKCQKCESYNLCERCEEQNSLSNNHPHFFIKIRKVEPSKNNQIYENNKIDKIDEKIESNDNNKSYCNISENISNLENKYSFELINSLLEITISKNMKKNNEKLKIKNNGDNQWPSNTKLICDIVNSTIKSEDINLNNLKKNESQEFDISLIGINNNSDVGEQKIIFHFNCDGKNYGDPLIVNIK